MVGQHFFDGKIISGGNIRRGVALVISGIGIILEKY